MYVSMSTTASGPLPPHWITQRGNLWTHAAHDIFPQEPGEVTPSAQSLLIGFAAVPNGGGVGSLQLVFGFGIGRRQPRKELLG